MEVPRRSAFTWLSAPPAWRALYTSWRGRQHRKLGQATGPRKAHLTQSDAKAAGIRPNDWYGVVRKDPEFWRWFGDQEELAAEELYANTATIKRDLAEVAMGLLKVNPVRLAAIKEWLTNNDPNWGKPTVRLEVTDLREQEQVQTTVQILMAALAAPQTHDLPLLGPAVPPDPRSEF